MFELDPDKYYTCLSAVCLVDRIKVDVIENEGMYDQSWAFDPRWLYSWTVGEVCKGSYLREHFGTDDQHLHSYFQEATEHEIFKHKLTV